MTASGRVRVAVVFGGRSNEHAISCVSAGSILRNLDPQRFEVVAVGITPEGSWVLTDGDPDALAITNRQLPAVSAQSGTELALPADPRRSGQLVSLQPGAGEVLASVDVVFPVLHGPYGEDGTIQGLLELAGVPYVGAGVLASATGMDKEFTKKLLVAEGLPVGAHAVLRPSQRDTGLPTSVNAWVCRCSSSRREAVRRSASTGCRAGTSCPPRSPTLAGTIRK